MAATKLPLHIWLDGRDEPLVVVADQRDTAALELEYQQSFPKLLGIMPEVVFRFIGWHSARRLGLIPKVVDGDELRDPTREEWLATVAGVEPPDDDDDEAPVEVDADPGTPAATDASS